MIYTNLDITKIADELRNRFKNITNKKFIKESIDYHYENGFITKAEWDELKNELEV